MKKILIAEDDPIVRKILVEVAKSEGFVTIEAGDGELARDILLSNRDFSMLITDMMMPNLSGRELITFLRGISEFKELPIIMVSGVVPLSQINDILQLGASRFLPKPIDVHYLREYLRAL